MKVNNLRELFAYCQSQHMPTYTDMILGMPNETLSSWKTGLLNLLDYGQHDMIIIYFTQLLENAEMMQQLEEYKIEYVKTDNWEAYYDNDVDLDPVREHKLVVNKTSTMSLEHMVQSYMFSWLITIFHSMGYTQSVSMYLHKSGAMSYREFYDQLEHYVANGTGLLNKEYRRIHQAVKDYLTHGNYEYDQQVMKHVPGDTLLWSSLFYFPREPAQVKFELKHFFDSTVRIKFFPNIDLYDQLVEFQFGNTIDYFQTYPQKITVASRIYNVIYDQQLTENYLDLTVDMHPDLKQLNLEQFCSALFVKKRNSLNKLLVLDRKVNHS